MYVGGNKLQKYKNRDMKVKMIMGVVAGMLVTTSFAQNQYDALRFLGDELNGTARFVGMGGAMSALGADINTMSTNPAGIGLYRRNDVALSFGWNGNKSSADWGGSISKESRGRASFFDQIGFVWSTKIGNDTKLRYVNFGFNYHKHANFNRQFSANGNLHGLSLTNQMANMLLTAGDESGLYYLTNNDFNDLLDASNPYISNGYNGFWGVSGTPVLGAMGARTGLVDAQWDEEGNIGDTDIFGWDGTSGQYYSREEGGINEYDFNLSFNVLDRFYFGATVGVYDIRYNRYSSYYEDITYGPENGGYFTLDNWYKTEGTGLDLKIGAIIRPMEYSPFRIGLAIHTPVWYTLTDRYTATLSSHYQLGEEKYAFTENLQTYFQPEYVWDYHLVTPWRFNVSAGTVLAGSVALGAEYEYETYPTSHMSDIDGNDLNGSLAIDEALKGVHTFRIGMETKIEGFAIRAGYNFKSAPIKEESFKNIPVTDNTRTDAEYMNMKSRQTLTVGLGYRGILFYADLGYKYDFYKGDFYAFDNVDLPAVKVNNDRHQLLFTLGSNF